MVLLLAHVPEVEESEMVISSVRFILAFIISWVFLTQVALAANEVPAVSPQDEEVAPFSIPTAAGAKQAAFMVGQPSTTPVSISFRWTPSSSSKPNHGYLFFRQIIRNESNGNTPGAYRLDMYALTSNNVSMSYVDQNGKATLISPAANYPISPTNPANLTLQENGSSFTLIDNRTNTVLLSASDSTIPNGYELHLGSTDSSTFSDLTILKNGDMIQPLGTARLFETSLYMANSTTSSFMNSVQTVAQDANKQATYEFTMTPQGAVPSGDGYTGSFIFERQTNGPNYELALYGGQNGQKGVMRLFINLGNGQYKLLKKSDPVFIDGAHPAHMQIIKNGNGSDYQVLDLNNGGKVLMQFTDSTFPIGAGISIYTGAGVTAEWDNVSVKVQ